MAYHIVNDSKGLVVNDMTFDSVDAAIEFARAPAWAGAGPTEITMTGDMSYKYLGQRYSIVAGANPKAARAEAKAAIAPREFAATPAQVRYLIALMDRVPASGYKVITGGKAPSAMTKAEASAAISKLTAIASA